VILHRLFLKPHLMTLSICHASSPRLLSWPWQQTGATRLPYSPWPFIIHQIERKPLRWQTSSTQLFFHLNKGLISLGFTLSKIDPCLYMLFDCLLAAYTDGCLIFAKEDRTIDDLITSLSKIFLLQDQDSMYDYLEIRVTKDPAKKPSPWCNLVWWSPFFKTSTYNMIPNQNTHLASASFIPIKLAHLSKSHGIISPILVN